MARFQQSLAKLLQNVRLEGSPLREHLFHALLSELGFVCVAKLDVLDIILTRNRGKALEKHPATVVRSALLFLLLLPPLAPALWYPFAALLCDLWQHPLSWARTHPRQVEISHTNGSVDACADTMEGLLTLATHWWTCEDLFAEETEADRKRRLQVVVEQHRQEEVQMHTRGEHLRAGSLEESVRKALRTPVTQLGPPLPPAPGSGSRRNMPTVKRFSSGGGKVAVSSFFSLLRTRTHTNTFPSLPSPLCPFYPSWLPS